MISEFRKLTDDEIKEIFFKTKKTHNIEVKKIDYIHSDLYPDYYRVETDKGIYSYESTVKYMRDYRKGSQHYDRIVKLKATNKGKQI